MAKRKNKVTAHGMIVKKGLLLHLIALRYRYKVKVPNIKEPLTLILPDTQEFKEGDWINVEYDPENPKRCKLAERYYR
jgi:hypothetical protein